MSIARSTALALATLALATSACDDKDAAKKTAASAAPSAAPPPSAAPSAAPEPTPSAAPAPLADNDACPKESVGPGTFDKPCIAKGKSRMMEVTHTGKTDDKGPQFRVVNKSPRVILWGKIAVYFYDKKGKQLEVTEGDKKNPFRTCSGNMFGGVMKVAEKAVITFSCVKKEHVPEGTAAVEAEMIGVGYADDTEKKADLYWSNPDLAPAARKKGAK